MTLKLLDAGILRRALGRGDSKSASPPPPVSPPPAAGVTMAFLVVHPDGLAGVCSITPLLSAEDLESE